MNDLGKISDTQSGWIPVVAAALRREDGLWLMQRRPVEKHHGGLWEFPGGKVEPSEIPSKALTRELSEELGIRARPEDCEPASFAQSNPAADNPPIVIMLYTIQTWVGTPRALEGGETGWFTRLEIESLPKPPLDEILAGQLFKKRRT